MEVDGPSHFMVNVHQPTGVLLARQRLLAARGWHVISVPHFVWQRCSEAERDALLQQVRVQRSMAVNLLRLSCCIQGATFPMMA